MCVCVCVCLCVCVHFRLSVISVTRVHIFNIIYYIYNLEHKKNFGIQWHFFCTALTWPRTILQQQNDIFSICGIFQNKYLLFKLSACLNHH